MKKKIVTLLMVLSVASLCACGNTETTTSDAGTTDTATAEETGVADPNASLPDPTQALAKALEDGDIDNALSYAMETGNMEVAQALSNGDIEQARAIFNGSANAYDASQTTASTTDTEDSQFSYEEHYYYPEEYRGYPHIHMYNLWSVYFLDNSNSFIDFGTKTNSYDPEVAVNEFKEELNPSLTNYPDVSVKIDIAKPVDGIKFDEDDTTVFLGEIDGRSTVMYRTEKSFVVKVLLDDERYFYMQASSALDGMSDEEFVDTMKDFISKCEFVSGKWTDL